MSEETVKQPLGVALVEHGLCYCSDDHLCHYHKELDEIKSENRALRVLLKDAVIGDQTPTWFRNCVLLLDRGIDKTNIKLGD